MGKDRVSLRWLDLLLHELKEWGIFCNFLLSGNAKMQRKIPGDKHWPTILCLYRVLCISNDASVCQRVKSVRSTDNRRGGGRAADRVLGRHCPKN